MKKWPNRKIRRRCPYSQVAGEVAADWARRGREFVAAEFYIEVFDQLNLRRVYLRKASADILVDGKHVKSWGGRDCDASEMLRSHIIGVCDAELRDQYGDRTPHFIDKEVGGRRSYLFIGAVKGPKRLEDEALMYRGQEFDLEVHRQWRLLVAEEMRVLSVTAEQAKSAVNTIDQVRANLLAGRSADA